MFRFAKRAYSVGLLSHMDDPRIMDVAQKEMRLLSINEMINFGQDVFGPKRDARILHSARYIHKVSTAHSDNTVTRVARRVFRADSISQEMPVRLARRLLDMMALPHVIACNHHIVDVSSPTHHANTQNPKLSPNSLEFANFREIARDIRSTECTTTRLTRF
jgi:hypothetical protein